MVFLLAQLDSLPNIYIKACAARFTVIGGVSLFIAT
jgi:hypothetical protein